MDSLKARLRWAREASGLSPRKLGFLAGLKSETHVGLIESGLRRHLEGSTLLALAEVLGVRPAWLLNGEGPDPTPESVYASVARARAAHEDTGEHALPATEGVGEPQVG